MSDRLLLFAGPCVVEGRDVVRRIAERLKEIAATRPVDFVFKASYDKANRTSVESFRGPGMDEALGILAEVRRDLGLKVNTDIHETAFSVSIDLIGQSSGSTPPSSSTAPIACSGRAVWGTPRAATPP